MTVFYYNIRNAINSYIQYIFISTPKQKYTREIEKVSNINFLHITLIKHNHHINKNYCTKDTNSDRYQNFIPEQPKL